MKPVRRRVLGSIGLTYGFAVLAYGLHSGIHGRTSPERVGEALAFAVAIATSTSAVVPSSEVFTNAITTTPRDRALRDG